MDRQTLGEIEVDLDLFCERFDYCFARSESRRYLNIYITGQLSDLERKSVEPMALEAGVPVRTLQEFLNIYRWDADKMRVRLVETVQCEHPDENAVGVIDGTTFVKKGDKTAGVQRQYCGTRGKTENCVSSVHLGYASGSFHALVDSDLYLPEQSWMANGEKREEAWIPEGLGFRTKWKIAVDLVTRSLAAGLHLKWITADEEFGRSGEFRESMDSLGLYTMVEIPGSLTGRFGNPDTERPGLKVHKISELWERGGPKWKTYNIKETEKGPIVWEARETHFYLTSHPAGKKERLIIARNVLTEEIKYFLSNAPTSNSLAKLLTVAFSRWHVEKLFQEAKGEVGLDHFEVRKYPSVIRHLTISNLSLYFLSHHGDRLKKKSLVDNKPAPGFAWGADKKQGGSGSVPEKPRKRVQESRVSPKEDGSRRKKPSKKNHSAIERTGV